MPSLSRLTSTPAARRWSISERMDRNERDLLRHTVATLAYRAAKALRDAPPSFAAFDAAGRSPLAILSHLGDLIEWAISMADGTRKWREETPESWQQSSDRFFDLMQRFDALLASDAELQCDGRRLVQGPIADALTHVGQLAMLRRMGAGIGGENYFKAEIAVGRVGAEQVAPKITF